MTQSDKWQKIADYDTNLQAELHANLLKNNGINVSLQSLSAIPGMNSGAVLWVESHQFATAQDILQQIQGVDDDGLDE